jgi:hypothetical protein
MWRPKSTILSFNCSNWRGGQGSDKKDTLGLWRMWENCGRSSAHRSESWQVSNDSWAFLRSNHNADATYDGPSWHTSITSLRSSITICWYQIEFQVWNHISRCYNQINKASLRWAFVRPVLELWAKGCLSPHLQVFPKSWGGDYKVLSLMTTGRSGVDLLDVKTSTRTCQAPTSDQVPFAHLSIVTHNIGHVR